MERWRSGLFWFVTAGSGLAWAWMILSVRPVVRTSLVLLTVAFTVGLVGVAWHYRARLSRSLVTANLALGALVHLAVAAVVVGVDRLWILGLVPALSANGHHFLLGLLGLAAATVTWTRARGGDAPAPQAVSDPSEPPPTTPALQEAPDWETLVAGVTEPALRRHLTSLQRLAGVVDDPEAARRVIHQEALRVVAAADAAEQDDDLLTRAAAFLEWGAQKIPELGELDAGDVLMGKVIADIRAQHDEVVRRFVDHRLLLPIHPIDRDTASQKADERAASARAARSLLQANGDRLSEDLVAAEPALEAFRSVTGFQVVALEGERGFVTFEGNGRREALARAFGDEVAIHVEVREYRFADAELRATIQRRVERVRRWKGLT